MKLKLPITIKSDHSTIFSSIRIQNLMEIFYRRHCIRSLYQRDQSMLDFIILTEITIVQSNIYVFHTTHVQVNHLRRKSRTNQPELSTTHEQPRTNQSLRNMAEIWPKPPPTLAGTWGVGPRASTNRIFRALGYSHTPKPTAINPLRSSTLKPSSSKF